MATDKETARLVRKIAESIRSLKTDSSEIAALAAKVEVMATEMEKEPVAPTPATTKSGTK